MKRIVLYPKDIQVLTGKNDKGARRLIRHIKTQFDIPPDVPLTVYAFCAFMRLNVEAVHDLLGN